MSFAALKKQNSLDSLLGAAQKESAPLEKKSYVGTTLSKVQLVSGLLRTH